jgi:hypothetical protein
MRLLTNRKRLAIASQPADRPVFLTFESVDRSRATGKNTLTFPIWPTIAFDGKVDFDMFVQDDSLDETFWHTIAHEMGHYYFSRMRRHLWIALLTGTAISAALSGLNFALDPVPARRHTKCSPRTRGRSRISRRQNVWWAHGRQLGLPARSYQATVAAWFYG